MQPRQVTMTLIPIVARIGLLCFVSTWEKNLPNGVALSRAKLHHIRPPVVKVPIRVGNVARKRMAMRPTAPAVEPVAWR